MEIIDIKLLAGPEQNEVIQRLSKEVYIYFTQTELQTFSCSIITPHVIDLKHTSYNTQVLIILESNRYNLILTTV